MLMAMEFTKEWASKEDEKCDLKSFREEFIFPQHNGKPVLYFTGNSLGLQSKRCREAVERHLDKWGAEAVDGHFTGEDQWFNLHAASKKGFAYMMGAKESEVSVMNGLTTNLHLMLSSFYKQNGTKKKIIIEEKAFPSDYYVVESFLRLQGLDPEENLLEIPYSEGKLFDTDTTKAFIDKHADDTALMLVGGLNYYSGQVLDMPAITQFAQSKNIVVGWDLAHAAGNVECQLHDWNVDFACWCTYKYMNSGPGAPSGIFVHEKHHKSNLPRMAGWWGYEQKTRFNMDKKFVPMEGADGWQQSNGPALAIAPIAASLSLFLDAGKEKLFSKRDRLSEYLAAGLHDLNAKLGGAYFEIISPKSMSERGSQVSIYVKDQAKELFDYMCSEGVVPDYRKPNVIRLAPVPLYNNFMDICETLKIIEAFYKK
tara:strand:- start:117892 stop:119169 length:1278 start_codon:yes stop_codon:yes gene_type:complete